MDLITIHQLLQYYSIWELKLRVTYYARVSTSKDAQINSLENQEAHFIEYIKKNSNWTLVPGYVDEGLSGATTKNRTAFQRMLKDARSGLFDLIITKEISRFARDVVDSLKYTRLLLDYGVAVVFENDSLNTIGEDAELRLTIMSAMAQEELRKLSSRVKFGHQQAIKNGVVLGNGRMFGYRKDNGRLIIDEAEAKMVKDLFDLCASGKYSLRALSRLLFEKGYKNHKGGKISYMTIKSIITNQKYKGYYVGNKYRSIDIASKKQLRLPPEDWVTFKDTTGHVVPAIVSEELWEKANEVLVSRTEIMKNRCGTYSIGNLFTGKLFCVHCDAPYYSVPYRSKDGNVHNRWECSAMSINGTTTCPSFILYEHEIFSAIIKIFSAQKPVARSLDQKVRINSIEQQIAAINLKKQDLLADNVCHKLSDSEFVVKNTNLNNELEQLNAERDLLLHQETLAKDRARKINTMYAVVKQLDTSASDPSSLKHFVDEFIDRIFITANDDNKSITLEICCIAGDTYRYKMEIPKGRKLKRKDH